MNTFLTTLVLATMAIADAQECPAIITRAQWGARAVRWTWLPIRPAPFVVVHHTAGAACTTQAACSAEMRAIQNMHINSNGWADIGYNFCIGGDGLVYQGRGWGVQGSHAPGYNNQSLGICFMGLFTSGLPTLAARNNAQQLIRCGVSTGQLSTSYWLIGHRQAVATECPGTALFNELRNWPRFNASPRPV
ncbi:unnamed protein product [Diamesa hyperborea]